MSLPLKRKEEVKRPYVRFVIDGLGGVGKSTAIATIAKKPLVVDLDGRFPQHLIEKSDFLAQGADYQGFIKVLRAVLEEPKIENDWLVLDTATKVMSLVEDWTIARDCAGQKEKYNAYGHGLKFAPQYFKEILDIVDQIQAKHQINVAFVCHTKVKEFKNPMTENYHKNVLDLPEIVAEKLKQWADYIGYAWFESEVDKDKKKAKDEVKRFISFTESPLYEAKNSSDFTIPAKIEFDKEGAWAEIVFGKTQALIKELEQLLGKFPAEYREAFANAIKDQNVYSWSVARLADFIKAGSEKLKQIKK